VDKKEMFDFITKNPTCYLATVEGKKPHVRPIGTFRADENGIIFSFQNYKNVYKQIVKNTEIEACYSAQNTQLRVNGKVEQVTDIALKKEVVAARPFLKPGMEKEGWDYVGVFILKHGKFCVMDAKTPPGVVMTWADF
jgi:pyridoxamine 5'-phosphate oxidase